MKRALLALALVLGALFTIGSAPAGAANGANCSLQGDPITYNGNSGYLQQRFWVADCTNVSQVQWTFATNGAIENFTDLSVNPIQYHLASNPPTIGIITCGRGGNVEFHGASGGVPCNNYLHVHPWCPPQTPHTVRGAALFRIYSMISHQYGPWTFVLSQNQSIWC
jgi:hypothetical protein